MFLLLKEYDGKYKKLICQINSKRLVTFKKGSIPSLLVYKADITLFLRVKLQIEPIILY